MRVVFVLLFAAVSVFGQDPALARLKQAVVTAKSQQEGDSKDAPARIAAVHDALRVWVESRLPKDVYSLAGESSQADALIHKELGEAGLTEPESARTDLVYQDPGFSYIRVELKMLTELPDILFVTAGVSVPCGEDQAVYAYLFDSNGRTRIINDHPKSESGSEDARLTLSEPDLQGRRLLLIDRSFVQCGSSWMRMSYVVYRMNSLFRAPELLLSDEHGFWLGNEDDGRLFALNPIELIIQFLDNSVDGGVHNRTRLFRYSFVDGMKRLEPMAFQPQDFAEEWLTRPWSEIQSRSAPQTQKWHSKLHADFVLGEYSNVILCNAKPDRWSIGTEIKYIGEKELKEPVEAHFLVRDLGNYRYEMEAVSDSEFEGCPGEGSPSDKHPWLSVDQLKALP